MKKMLFALVVLCAVGLASGGINPDCLAGRVLSDGEVIRGEGGVKVQNVEYGIWGQWHEDSPKVANGFGGYALLDVNPDITFPLRNLLPYVGEWMKLPETLSARTKVGVDMGVVNIYDDLDFMVSPLADVQMGPIYFRTQYNWVSGGGNTGVAQSEARVMLGFCYPIK